MGPEFFFISDGKVLARTGGMGVEEHHSEFAEQDSGKLGYIGSEPSIQNPQKTIWQKLAVRSS